MARLIRYSRPGASSVDDLERPCSAASARCRCARACRPPAPPVEHAALAARAGARRRRRVPATALLSTRSISVVAPRRSGAGTLRRPRTRRRRAPGDRASSWPARGGCPCRNRPARREMFEKRYGLSSAATVSSQTSSRFSSDRVQLVPAEAASEPHVPVDRRERRTPTDSGAAGRRETAPAPASEMSSGRSAMTRDRPA